MKLGIWGLGSIGQRHAKNAAGLGLEVIGYDPDAARAAMLPETIGKSVESEDELLKQSDAIVICSPNNLHFDHLKRSIANGCHVLIEKPLAHITDGLEKLFAEAKEKNLVIAPAMNMRFDGVVQKTKEIIEEGWLGKPLWARFLCSAYLPDWRPHQDHRKGYTNNPITGGVIFDIIHEFDIAHYLLGAMKVKSCHAHNSGSVGLDVEDCADIALVSEKDKAAVSIHLDYISKFNQRHFEIQFEEKNLYADLNERQILVRGPEGEILRKELITQSGVQCYIDEMSSFIAAIEGKEPYLCSSEEALQVLENVIDSRRLAGLPS